MEKLIQNKHNKFLFPSILINTERHNLSPPTFLTKLKAEVKTTMVNYNWKRKVPKKVKLFIWLVMHKSLDASDKLPRVFIAVCA